MSFVLVAVRDERLRHRVIDAGRSVGFAVRAATDEVDALRLLHRLAVTVLVIEVGDDDVQRRRLLGLLRGGTHAVMAAVPAATSDVVVEVLRQGADAVVDGRSTLEELGARIDAAARRAARYPSDVLAGRLIRTGELMVDRGEHTVTRCGRPVSLSHREFRLLDALAARIGLVATHNYLESVIWGEPSEAHRQLLRAYVRKVRSKLEDDPSRPRYLLSEWGRGYRLADLPLDTGPPRRAVRTGAGAVAGTRAAAAL
ncbi:MAG: hypothetical protein GEU80_12990 [Dehalococcoidia bacterium]|nr:hypothetical protein [Dehalococcoidia bacterium]